MDSLSLEQLCEIGGKEFVSGYVAAKVGQSSPDLIASSEERLFVEKYSWVASLNKEGLTVPSIQWRNQCDILYKEFCDHHDRYRYGLNTKVGVLKGHLAHLEVKYPDIPATALRKFVTTVLFIRIKNANRKIKADAEKKRQV